MGWILLCAHLGASATGTVLRLIAVVALRRVELLGTGGERERASAMLDRTLAELSQSAWATVSLACLVYLMWGAK